MKRTEFDAAFITARRQIDPETGCWNWTGAINAGGRPTYNDKYAYRISHEVYIGPLGGRQVNHHCDNPRCVNPDHFYAGTQWENMRDARERGLVKPPEAVRGEEQWLAYPDALVDTIRARYLAGEMQKDLAVEHGISIGQVRRWISGGDRGRTPIRRKPASCGTRAGYCAHIYREEATCQPCKDANTAYLRDYKAKRRLGRAA